MTLQHFLPNLGAISIILVPFHLPDSNIVCWECYIYSEHGGSLFRTETLYRTAEDALMRAYVRYRWLVAEHAVRGRATCEWCNGGWDQESESESEAEDEGYSEI